MVASDTELINNWKKLRDYNSYKELKKRHQNMVYQMVNRYASASLPRNALEAESWRLFDDAVDTFKEGMNAQFITHLNFQLRKIDRFAKKYQNTARIPEAIASKIGDYDRANQELSISLGRVPTHKEMAKKLKMPLKHVKQIHVSRRGDLFEGMYTEGFDPTTSGNDLDWIFVEARDELNQQELEVYDHLIGYNKPQIKSKKELAKKLNMSPGRISQINSSIARKIKPYVSKYI